MFVFLFFSRGVGGRFLEWDAVERLLRIFHFFSCLFLVPALIFLSLLRTDVTFTLNQTALQSLFPFRLFLLHKLIRASDTRGRNIYFYAQCF